MTEINTCMICFDKYTTADPPMLIAICGHTFGGKCLNSMPTNTCPICRKPFHALIKNIALMENVKDMVVPDDIKRNINKEMVLIDFVMLYNRFIKFFNTTPVVIKFMNMNSQTSEIYNIRIHKIDSLNEPFACKCDYYDMLNGIKYDYLYIKYNSNGENEVIFMDKYQLKIMRKFIFHKIIMMNII